MKNTLLVLLTLLCCSQWSYGQSPSEAPPSKPNFFISVMPSPLVIPFQLTIGLEKRKERKTTSFWLRTGVMIEAVNFSAYLRREYELVSRDFFKQSRYELGLPLWIGLRNFHVFHGEETPPIFMSPQIGLSIVNRFYFTKSISFQAELGAGTGPVFANQKYHFPSYYYDRFTVFPLLELSFAYHFGQRQKK